MQEVAMALDWPAGVTCCTVEPQHEADGLQKALETVQLEASRLGTGEA